MDFKSLSNFDWRSLQKYASPQASEDLNKFLEKLPQNSSQLILIVAGIAWGIAGTVGLAVTVKVQELTELQATYEEAQALKPQVPTINDVPVSPDEIKKFAAEISELYTDLEVKPSSSQIDIRAKSLVHFGQFREAIGHVQNGGSGWRVNVERLCVGKECNRQPLAATLKINKVKLVPATPAGGI